MLRRIVVFILLLLVAQNVLQAEKKTVFKEKKTYKYEFTIGYENKSSSGYRDHNNEFLTEYWDSTYKPIIRDTISNDTMGYYKRNVIFSFFTSTINFGAKYTVNPNLSFQINAPLSFYSFEEQWGKKIDSAGNINFINYTDKANGKKDLTRLDYIELKSEYVFVNNRYYFATAAGTRIPTGSNNSVMLNDESDFLSDGWFELNPEITSGFNFGRGKLLLNLGYSYRGEEMTDLVKAILKLDLNSIENTSLLFSLNYIKSLGEIKNEYHFIPRSEVLWEEALYFDGKFTLHFSDHFGVAAGAFFDLYGINRWSSSGFNFNLIYRY